MKDTETSHKFIKNVLPEPNFGRFHFIYKFYDKGFNILTDDVKFVQNKRFSTIILTFSGFMRIAQVGLSQVT